jgi:hypothetical protein
VAPVTVPEQPFALTLLPLTVPEKGVPVTGSVVLIVHADCAMLIALPT